MLHRTRGLALKLTRYAESSVVAQIYTQHWGLQAYLIQGAKRPKARIPVNILQPFHLLEIVAYHKDTSQLQRIREVQQQPVLLDIPLNIAKSTLAIFLNEVLYKVLRHQQADTVLFQFIADSILWLDRARGKVGNFHLLFLLKLSRYLGFYPILSNKPYLNLAEGIFTDTPPPHSYALAEPATSLFRRLMETDYDHMQDISISREDRSYLLQKLLDFYRLHTENFGEVLALQVLEDVFA